MRSSTSILADPGRGRQRPNHRSSSSRNSPTPRSTLALRTSPLHPGERGAPVTPPTSESSAGSSTIPAPPVRSACIEWHARASVSAKRSESGSAPRPPPEHQAARVRLSRGRHCVELAHDGSFTSTRCAQLQVPRLANLEPAACSRAIAGPRLPSGVGPC